MRILTINTVFSKGGAANIARYLHTEINKTKGFTSIFAYGRGKQVNIKNTFKFGYDMEFFSHVFLTYITGLQGYGSYFSTKKLEKYILKNNFDIIHLHNLHGYYLDISFFNFLSKLKIPIIWTLHDNWPITGRCTYPFNCSRWKKGCGKCPNLSWYPKTFFDNSKLMWMLKKEQITKIKNLTLVCPSKWLAKRVTESYLKKYKITVIPNGIDTNFFRPYSERNIKKIRDNLTLNNKKIILFIGADIKDKRRGLKYFIKSISYLKREEWIILLVGEKVNIKSNIDILQLGYIPRELLPFIYNIADIFCITSLEDNFPTTVLESMSCGTPIVGFKVGGIPEQVSSNCGILVEPEDSKSLSESFYKIMEDNIKYKKYCKNSRKRVLSYFSLEKFKSRYLNLYVKL